MGDSVLVPWALSGEVGVEQHKARSASDVGDVLLLLLQAQHVSVVTGLLA